MRNSLGGAAPENAQQGFSGGFAATDGTDFELIHYTIGTGIWKEFLEIFTTAHPLRSYFQM